MTQSDRQFLQNFLQHQGILTLTFYNSGETISTYEKIENDDEDDLCWRITQVIPWSSIELDKKKNYLIFNKLLEEEVGSMAYQRDDCLWCPSTKLKGRSQVDFYSQLKKKYNYLDTGEFYSIQGINIPEFQIIQQAKQGRQKEGEETKLSIFNYPSNIDIDTLRQDCQIFYNRQYLDVENSLICYLSQQNDSEAWENFCKTYKLKIAPEFQKILIEIGIKNWIKQSLINPDLGLPITPQLFSKQQFYAIYVRSPKKQNAQAVAVKFLYQNNCIYIKDVLRNLKQIERKFKFLRRKKSNELMNDQQYFVDESEKIYISSYTDNYYTPTLIGRHGILEELEKTMLQVNKTIKSENDSKLLPLAMYYNSVIYPIKRIQNFICLDLQKETFIQYYIPSNQPVNARIKKGFRVYHLIGNTYSDSGESIPTSELVQCPLAALHFSTLTQNILKISDNSQSSLLQKIAKVLIEN